MLLVALPESPTKQILPSPGQYLQGSSQFFVHLQDINHKCTFFGHQSVKVVFPDPARSHFVDGALQIKGAPVLLQCDRLEFHGL
jgi:hypothetical protein